MKQLADQVVQVSTASKRELTEWTRHRRHVEITNNVSWMFNERYQGMETHWTAFPVNTLALEGQHSAFVQKCLLYVVPRSAKSFFTFGITSIESKCKSENEQYY